MADPSSFVELGRTFFKSRVRVRLDPFDLFDSKTSTSLDPSPLPIYHIFLCSRVVQSANATPDSPPPEEPFLHFRRSPDLSILHGSLSSSSSSSLPDSHIREIPMNLSLSLHRVLSYRILFLPGTTRSRSHSASEHKPFTLLELTEADTDAEEEGEEGEAEVPPPPLRPSQVWRLYFVVGGGSRGVDGSAAAAAASRIAPLRGLGIWLRKFCGSPVARGGAGAGGAGGVPERHGSGSGSRSGSFGRRKNSRKNSKSKSSLLRIRRQKKKSGFGFVGSRIAESRGGGKGNSSGSNSFSRRRKRRLKGGLLSQIRSDTQTKTDLGRGFTTGTSKYYRWQSDEILRFLDSMLVSNPILVLSESSAQSMHLPDDDDDDDRGRSRRRLKKPKIFRRIVNHPIPLAELLHEDDMYDLETFLTTTTTTTTDDDGHADAAAGGGDGRVGHGLLDVKKQYKMYLSTPKKDRARARLSSVFSNEDFMSELVGTLRSLDLHFDGFWNQTFAAVLEKLLRVPRRIRRLEKMRNDGEEGGEEAGNWVQSVEFWQKKDLFEKLVTQRRHLWEKEELRRRLALMILCGKTLEQFVVEFASNEESVRCAFEAGSEQLQQEWLRLEEVYGCRVEALTLRLWRYWEMDRIRSAVRRFGLRILSFKEAEAETQEQEGEAKEAEEEEDLLPTCATALREATSRIEEVKADLRRTERLLRRARTRNSADRLAKAEAKKKELEDDLAASVRKIRRVKAVRVEEKRYLQLRDKSREVVSDSILRMITSKESRWAEEFERLVERKLEDRIGSGSLSAAVNIPIRLLISVNLSAKKQQRVNAPGFVPDNDAFSPSVVVGGCKIRWTNRSLVKVGLLQDDDGTEEVFCADLTTTSSMMTKSTFRAQASDEDDSESVRSSAEFTISSLAESIIDHNENGEFVSSHSESRQSLDVVSPIEFVRAILWDQLDVASLPRAAESYLASVMKCLKDCPSPKDGVRSAVRFVPSEAFAQAYSNRFDSVIHFADHSALDHYVRQLLRCDPTAMTSQPEAWTYLKALDDAFWISEMKSGGRTTSHDCPFDEIEKRDRQQLVPVTISQANVSSEKVVPMHCSTLRSEYGRIGQSFVTRFLDSPDLSLRFSDLVLGLHPTNEPLVSVEAEDDATAATSEIPLSEYVKPAGLSLDFRIQTVGCPRDLLVYEGGGKLIFGVSRFHCLVGIRHFDELNEMIEDIPELPVLLGMETIETVDSAISALESLFATAEDVIRTSQVSVAARICRKRWTSLEDRLFLELRKAFPGGSPICFLPWIMNSLAGFTGVSLYVRPGVPFLILSGDLAVVSSVSVREVERSSSVPAFFDIVDLEPSTKHICRPSMLSDNVSLYQHRLDPQVGLISVEILEVGEYADFAALPNSGILCVVAGAALFGKKVVESGTIHFLHSCAEGVRLICKSGPFLGLIATKY